MRHHHCCLHDILREYPDFPLVYLLIRHEFQLTKIKTELRHIGAWLSKLTRLTIETGSLTGIDFVFIMHK